MEATTATEGPRGPAADGFLERRFALTERGTTPRVEALGGVSTFLTMSYILFVNPAILSAAGLPFEAVAVVTAIAAALASAAMGLIANLPLALASGLGLNAIVAFDLVLGRGLEWPVAMAAIVVEGAIAFVLVLLGLREAIMRAIPLSLKLAIGVGIGLFITLVGFREAGITVNNEATGIGLGDLTAGPPLIALAGLLVALALAARGVRGATVAGIAAATVLGLIFGVLEGPTGVVDVPDGDDFSTIGDALAIDNLADVLTFALIPVIFTLFMVDFFDTLGTAVAVGRSGGLLNERGELPGIRRVLLVDSAAAATGGAMGASSVTTYIESGAGVGEGARTGLASVVTAGLFALAIFFVPVIALAGQGVQVGEDAFIHPAIAPALIMVGYLMMRIVPAIDWSAPENAIPAFMTIVGIPLTFEIAAGIGFGVIGYVVTMTVLGRAREVHALMWAITPLFLLFFAEGWLSENVF